MHVVFNFSYFTVLFSVTRHTSLGFILWHGVFGAIINIFYFIFLTLLVHVLLIQNYMVNHSKLWGLKVIEVR